MGLYILRNKNLDGILVELHKNGILKDFLPELCNLDSKKEGHKNNFYHTISVFKNTLNHDDSDLKLKIVALLHDIGKISVRGKNEDGNWTFHGHEKIGADMSIEILKRFNITNKKNIDYIYSMILNHGRLRLHRDITESAIRRLDTEVGNTIILDLIEFCKCDITTKYDDKRNRIVSGLDVIKDRIIEVRKKDLESKWRSPITGTVIMDILGVTTGRVVGDIKKITDEKIKSGEWNEQDGLNFIYEYKKGVN